MFQLPTEHFRWVSPGYFETIRLPLIAGRLLSSSDEGKRYAVISELTARTLWPGKNPVGQQFSRAGRKEDAIHGDRRGWKRAHDLARDSRPDDGVCALLVSQ